MIGGLITRAGASRWAGATLRCSLIVAAILLFLLSIRRVGERTGRLLERLDAMEKTNYIQRDMLEAAARRPRAIMGSLLAGCGTGGSDGEGIHACPPVADYDAGLQVRATAEVEALPADSLLADMLSDYAVLRDQARACRTR